MLTTFWCELFLFGFVASISFSIHLLLRTMSSRWLLFDRLGSILAIFSATIVAVDALEVLNCYHYRRFQPWGSFPLIAVLVGYCWMCLRGWSWYGKRGMELIKQPCMVCLLIATPALSGWCWFRIHDFDLLGDFALDSCTPGEIVEEPRLVGLTDTGSPLTLYRLEASDELYSKFATATQERIARLAKPLIVRAEPTRDCNCHGWVFTGGQHLIRGESVEKILVENTYHRVTQPKDDDVAIYRSSTGKILHTGLVRTVLSDGTILIESKWGLDGRFLHNPENQPYSQIIEYYRRSRETHLITFQAMDSTRGTTVLNASGCNAGRLVVLK